MPKPITLKYLRGFRVALATGSERKVQAFLDKNFRPLYQLFAQGRNALAVVPQFPFGRDFRADYLVLSAHSGAVFAGLLELESPSARLYLRDGTASKVLRVAQRQVSDWQAWIDETPLGLRSEVLRVLVAQSDDPDDAPFPGYRARLFRSLLEGQHLPLIHFFVIIIGRRGDLSEADQKRRTRRQLADTEIATYDRILDVAKEDQARARNS